MRCVLLLLAVLLAASDARSKKAQRYKRLPKTTAAPDTGDLQEHGMITADVHELQSRVHAEAMMRAHQASIFGLFRDPRNSAAARAFAGAAAELSGAGVEFVAGTVGDDELRHALNAPLDPYLRPKEGDERDRVLVCRGEAKGAKPHYAALITDAQVLGSKDELVGHVIEALGWTKMSDAEVEQAHLHGEL
eukprot:g2023.t1